MIMNNHNESSQSFDKTRSKIKSSISSIRFIHKAKDKGVLDILFTGLSPSSLGLISGVFLVFLFISLIFCVVPPSTLFTTTAPETKTIEDYLLDGYDEARKQASDYLIETLNSMYDCKATSNNLSYQQDTGTFLLSNDYAELEINFNPGLSEFAQQIDSYANALNGVINLYEDAEDISVDDVNIQEPLTKNGSLTLYGKKFVNSLKSEYLYSQSESYYESLSKYSKEMFSYETDISKWTFSNIRKKYKTKYITRCYVENKVTGSKRGVACSIRHDLQEQEEVKTLATYGNVTVYMNCDPTKYKYDEYLATINNAIGTQMYKEVTDNNQTANIKKVTLNSEEAKDVVDEVLNTYYFSYLSLYTGYDYAIGYTGKVNSNGWDYGISININDTGTINNYWSYSRSLDYILHSLKYKTDNKASGPLMNNQCTQFAATFFYDIYGFAALRGDGVNMADYLLKDCGEDSNAPVKFTRSMSVAPGAIVSLYPNHVIVVDEVDEDGSIYISEGNIADGKIVIHKKYEGGLMQYQKQTGRRVKTIAIAIENQFD